MPAAVKPASTQQSTLAAVNVKLEEKKVKKKVFFFDSQEKSLFDSQEPFLLFSFSIAGGGS